MTRAEFEKRLFERFENAAFRRGVHDVAIASAQSNAPPIDVSQLHEEVRADRFLARAAELFGTIDVELADRIRVAFELHRPPRWIVHLLADNMAKEACRYRRIEGVWWPCTIPVLLSIPDHAFTVSLYRSLLWRDPTPHEQGAVAAEIRVGTDRREIISHVAGLPTARALLGQIDGIVDLTHLMDVATDHEFVLGLYMAMFGRRQQHDEIKDLQEMVRTGTTRKELMRRLLREASNRTPHLVFVGVPKRARRTQRLL